MMSDVRPVVLAMVLAIGVGSASADDRGAIQLAQAAPPPAPLPPQPPAPVPVRQTWTVYHGASELLVRDAIAIVRIRPEDREDIAVSIRADGRLPAPSVRKSGRKLIIDGRAGPGASCGGDVGAPRAAHARFGHVASADFPIIDIRTPEVLDAALNGALFTTIGPALEAQLAIAGCGQTLVGPVDGDFDLALSGSADAVVGAVGVAQIRIAGAGDVILAGADALDVSIAGAGDLSAAHLDGGPARIAIQGAGDVVIAGGEADSLTVAIAGSGDVVFRGVARTLDAAIAGSGDVVVRHVEGRVNQRVIGGGEVVVGH